MIEIFLSAFVSLFVIVDPIGTAAVFAGLTKNRSVEIKKSIARRCTIIAAMVLLSFGFIGKELLELTGISLPAFKIAGGLLLFVTAFRMIMGGVSTDAVDDEGQFAKSNPMEIAVFPLAVPLLAGPGCMTATILHMNQANDLLAKLTVGGAIILVEIIAFICLIGAVHVTRLVGHAGTSLISRLLGVLLAALSVQFVVDGILAFV